MSVFRLKLIFMKIKSWNLETLKVTLIISVFSWKFCVNELNLQILSINAGQSKRDDQKILTIFEQKVLDRYVETFQNMIEFKKICFAKFTRLLFNFLFLFFWKVNKNLKYILHWLKLNNKTFLNTLKTRKTVENRFQA